MLSKTAKHVGEIRVYVPKTPSLSLNQHLSLMKRRQTFTTKYFSKHLKKFNETFLSSQSCLANKKLRQSLNLHTSYQIAC